MWSNSIIFLIICINYVLIVLGAQNIKCNYTVDITNGEKQGDSIIKDGIIYKPENYFSDGSHIKGCICNIKTCFKKCCEDGQSVEPNDDILNCVNNSGTFAMENVDLSLYHIIHGNTCPYETQFKIVLNPDETSFRISKDAKVLWGNKSYNFKNSCFDTIDTKSIAVVCYGDETGEEIGSVITSLGMIISMPFLLATFIAYALLPDRNLHMKALMCYVINLMFGYLCLVIIQLSDTKFEPASCKTLGYFCLFFFMVSFLWMNVICIDIYLAFSGLRGFTGSKSGERKRFLIYCGYAWGLSILHILCVGIIHLLADDYVWYSPGIGTGQCFMALGYPELLYFYGPMGLLIAINVILYSITAWRIRSIKKDTAMLKKDDSKRHSYENDKQKFNLYLKLLFAMGVNWSLELISWAVTWNVPNTPAAVWYLTDVCNAVYGVFIFFIFVFKRSIWKLLKKRYYSFIGKPHLAHSMTTNPTRTTSYSTTHTSVADSHHGGAITDSTVLTTEA